jgi:hypothetical protein
MKREKKSHSSTTLGDLSVVGVKFDEGKPRTDLLDPFAIEQLSKVLGFGAMKYAPENWRRGIAYSRLIAAALRHIFAFMRGENTDPESNLSHIAHAMCCMMFLLWMVENKPTLDDRWKSSNEHTDRSQQ